MPQPVSVLLLDDGELDDVQKMLEDMKIPFGRVRGASIAPGMPGPTDLLIATPRRLDCVRQVQGAHPESSAAVRIVVTTEDSNALRDRLRRSGFDYIVRRPVHPEALRLLILHALYTGAERRSEPRVPMGFEVDFKSGLVSRQATLADLSSRGCRLLTRHQVESGKRLRIQIPEELGATEALVLRGRVLRSRFEKRLGTQGLYSLAILFEKLSNEARKELEWILEARARGPARLDEGEPRDEAEPITVDGSGLLELPARNLRSDPRFEPDGPPPRRTAHTRRVEMPESPPQEPPRAVSVERAVERTPDTGDERRAGSLQDRRQVRRAAFAAKVPAFGSRALRVLVGRDISVRGMRVEASADVDVGDRLHLAIYGDPGEEPFLVWATVDRDDGEQGMAIAFDELHEVVATRLEKLVASLPAVESLQDDETEAMGSVISEVLPEGDR